MAAFRRAYDIVQQTIEILDNSEITWFEIDGISLRIDYLTRTLVNLDGNCTPTDEIVLTMGVTGLHNSYPRVLASLKFGSNEYVFKGSAPFVRNDRGILKYLTK